jgi:hypothetical protein
MALAPPEVLTKLHEISRHSSHRVRTTLSLEGKVLAINKDVLDLNDIY